MKIVYLHGFASSGTSIKSEQLVDRFGSKHVLAPNLSMEPKEVRQVIDNIVRSNNDWPLIFVGTSLGGFYAKWAAKMYDTPAVIVNPAIHPAKTLYQWLGKNKNFATGKDFDLTIEHLEELQKMENQSKNTNGALIHVFTDTNDDIVPNKDVLEALPHTAFTKVTTGFGHRFESGWPMVVDYISKTWGNPTK